MPRSVFWCTLGAVASFVACCVALSFAPHPAGASDAPATYSPEALQEQSAHYLAPSLLDPASARVTSALLGHSGEHVAFCGEVVARNVAGGMSTPKAFIVIPALGITMLEGTGDDQALLDVWQQDCPH